MNENDTRRQGGQQYHSNHKAIDEADLLLMADLMGNGLG